MINSEYRFPLYDSIMHGSMHPFLASNNCDAFLLGEVQHVSVPPVTDKGIYILSFQKPQNLKCRFYYDRICSETLWYCNNLIEILSNETDQDIKAYWRLTLLDRHLKTALIKTGEILHENDFTTADYISPLHGIDCEKLSNSYIFHLLKVCLAKAYLEVQNVLGATPGKQMDETTLYTGFVLEIPPTKSYLKKRSTQIADVNTYEMQENADNKKTEPTDILNIDSANEKKYTIKDLTEMGFGNERTIRRWLERGEMHGNKTGKIWKIGENQLTRFKEEIKKPKP